MDQTAATTAGREQLLAETLPTIRAILKRKSGMSLADDDARRDNVDAIELYHEVLARVWERIAKPGASEGVNDVRAYAATVTHNTWSDYLREKYPRRASLKNRLRYFLGHQSRYAIWESMEGETLCGFRKWLLGDRRGAEAASTARIHALREGRDKLAAGTVSTRPMEQFDANHWDQLLDALFTRLAGPIAVDDLVAVVVQLIALKEDRIESLDDEGDDDEPVHDIADESAAPERIAEMRSALRALWAAIIRLKPDYRSAYLLNLPGPGKSRCDIEVFVTNGIVGIADIGIALGLTDSQYQSVWPLLDMEDSDRADVAILVSAEEQFFLLWKYLPLVDAIIAQLLGLGQQQVINRRMLAMRELARALTDKNK